MQPGLPGAGFIRQEFGVTTIVNAAVAKPRSIPWLVAKRLSLGLAAAAILAAMGFAVLALQVYRYGNTMYAGQADAAIVLGAASWQGTPSPVFKERINHAIALYKTGTVNALIFTGGVSAEDTSAESEAARDYAIEQGVPPEAIHIETASTVTYENLRQARAIAAAHPIERVLIVTDPLHMRRSVTMARDLGLDAHPSPTASTRYRTWKTKRGMLLRETYYYTGYLLTRPFRDR
jgi:uncharacterized SAM-binding protein YcdF (DUF218 family)